MEKLSGFNFEREGDRASIVEGENVSGEDGKNCAFSKIERRGGMEGERRGIKG
jgi:hypothetical protein